MQQSTWNNPVFGSGMADLVANYLGNPRDAAASALMASQAGEIADTRTYRQNIGTAGAEKDLAGLLTSALQAGDNYSDNAPVIASSLASLPEYGMDTRTQGNIQVGTGTQKARDTFSGLAMALAKTGGGGRRSSGGGGSAAPAATVTGEPLSAGMRSHILRGLDNAGVEDPGVAARILRDVDGLARGGMDETSALAYALDPENWQVGEDVTTESWLPFGIGDETVPGQVEGLRVPEAEIPDVGQPMLPEGYDVDMVLEEARQALAEGKDRTEILLMLRKMGIDAGSL